MEDSALGIKLEKGDIRVQHGRGPGKETLCTNVVGVAIQSDMKSPKPPASSWEN